MSINVNLTQQQGTPILRIAYQGVFPEKVGKKEFTTGMRATFLKEMRLLTKALKKVSQILLKYKKLYFGPEGWYTRNDSTEKGDDLSESGLNEQLKFIVLEQHLHSAQDVALTGEARNGLYRVLYLLSHPGSPFCVGGGLQDDIVWAVADQIHCVPALEEAIGLNAGETVQVRYDDDPQDAAKPGGSGAGE